MGSLAVGRDTFVDRAGDHPFIRAPGDYSYVSWRLRNKRQKFKGDGSRRDFRTRRGHRRASARGVPAGLGASEIRRRHYTRPAL